MRKVALLLAALSVLSCGSVPDKRVQELLVARGFGKRAEGDAQVKSYASVGSQIQFFMGTGALMTETFQDLLLLVATPQMVADDGTIYIPGYGPTYVLGMTEEQIGALVSTELKALYTEPPQVTARIIDSLKYFFVLGEAGPGAFPFRGDLTIFEVMMTVPRSMLANIGKIRLVRADPKNPLVVTFNMRDMGLDGYSTYNVNVREFDIIYVPPTFLGMISRFIEKLFAPLTSLINAIFQWTTIRYQWGVFTGNEQGYYGGSGWFY